MMKFLLQNYGTTKIVGSYVRNSSIGRCGIMICFWTNVVFLHSTKAFRSIQLAWELK